MQTFLISKDIKFHIVSLPTPANGQANDPLESSDHVPITETIQHTIATCRATRSTYRILKADCQGFTDHCERKFGNADRPTSLTKGVKIFNKIVNKASSRFIPQGKIPATRLNFPSEAAKLAIRRDTLRQDDPGNPETTLINLSLASATIRSRPPPTGRYRYCRPLRRLFRNCCCRSFKNTS